MTYNLGGSSLPVIQATRVKDFVGTLGVNTACRQYITPDIDTATLVSKLQYIGASAIRDTLPATTNDATYVLPYWQYVVNAGIKLCISTVGNNETLSVSYLIGALQSVSQLGTNCLLYVEQTNEPNNNKPIYNGSTVTATGSPGYLPVTQFTAAYYIAAKANAFLHRIPVLGVSLVGAQPDNSGMQFLAIPSGYSTTLTTNASTAISNATLHFASTTGRKVGDYVYGTGVAANTTISSLTSTTVVMSAVATAAIASGASIRFGASMPESTQFADVLNVHCYPMFGGVNACAQSIDPTFGDIIDLAIQSNFCSTFGGAFTGYSVAAARALPKVITEYGYEQVGVTAGGSPVTQIIAARNILTAWLNAWWEGFAWFFIYRIYDEGPTLGYYGIYAYDESPRLMATYLHNFTTILADTGVQARTFSAAPVACSISNLPSTGRTMLFQRSDGTYFLVLWNNVTNWNVASGVAITVSATSVNLSFDKIRSISIYDPSVGTSVTASSTSTNVSVALSDYPMIVSFV